MNEITFETTIEGHLTLGFSTMYLLPVKTEITLTSCIVASVNLYENNLHVWDDSADTEIDNAIHATPESEEKHHHEYLSATMCEDSNVKGMFLKNSLHQPRCRSDLLLVDTLDCQWSNREVFIFLENILHELPITLHKELYLVIRCQLPFTHSNLLQNFHCCVTESPNNAQGPVLMSRDEPAAIQGILHRTLKLIFLIQKITDGATLMTANDEENDLRRSATTYCSNCNRKKVLTDASITALMMHLPPEDVPCAPPDGPPDIFNRIERYHSVPYYLKRL